MKNLFLTLVLTFNFIIAFTNSVSKETAQKVAVNFFIQKSNLKASKLTLKNSFETKKDTISTTYTFNFEGGGWIIISADDIATPVLAYSPEGTIDEKKINPAARFWINKYNDQIYSAITNNVTNKSANAEWQAALENKIDLSNPNVAPLLKTTWNQTQFYNDLCPSDINSPNGYNGHVPSGCVAMAMSQIMYYYSFPNKGLGYHSYMHEQYGLLSANFGNTAYNWQNIPLDAFSANSNLATLVYQCGVAVNMNYGATGSGAYNEDVPQALKGYFNYSDSVQLFYLSNDSTSYELWITRLKNELVSNRPVYYAGADTNDAHAFVCDGYDNSYPTKFHFNWGWGGYMDGYFVIGALNPDANHFNFYNTIITGIKPNTDTTLICRISSPEDRAVIKADTTLQISVNVAHGNPTKITLFIDNIPEDSITSAPFTFSIKPKNLIADYHKIKIVATNGIQSSIHEIKIAVTSKFWQLQKIVPSSEQLSISYLSVVDTNVVWACLGGANNLFVKTTDGGKTWTTKNISASVTNGLSLSNISAINASKAYACLNPGNNSGGAILFTSNGGTTWVSQTTNEFINSWADWVYFFDSNNGVCMGDPYSNRFFIYTTNNGGSTWNKVSNSNLPIALNGEAGIMNNFDVYQNSIWFGTSQGRVYKSSDKGLTWSVTSRIINNGDVVYVKLKDASNAIAYDGSYSSTAFYKTTDAGKTWEQVNSSGYPYYNNMAFVRGTKSTWINTNWSESSVSFNDDSLSTIFDRSTYINDLKFISPTAGWAGSNYISDLNGAGIYKWGGSFSNIKNYTISFVVTDENNLPVSNVEIDMNNGAIFTDNKGKAQFIVNNLGNPYSYSANITGYSPQTTNYFATNDTTITIVLKQSGTVIFNITNQLGSPAVGINVNFNGTSEITDASGKAIFNDIAMGGQYPYSVINNYKYLDFGIINVNQLEQTINISYQADEVSSMVENSTTIYPNPASDYVHIVTGNNIISVKIFNTSGLLIMNKTINGNEIEIPVQSFENGLYFIQLKNKKSINTHKLIIRHF